MNSKELVKRTIQFKSPERLPFTGSMAESDFSGDTVAVFPDMGTEWWLGGGGYDEWGCFWEVDPEHNDMGQVKNIILDKLEEFMLQPSCFFSYKRKSHICDNWINYIYCNKI